MTDEQLSAQDFGAAFKGFLEQAATGVPDEESIFAPAAPGPPRRSSPPRSSS